MVIIIVGMIGVGKIMLMGLIVDYFGIKVFYELVGDNFVLLFYYLDFKNYGFLL